jgi:threonine aldolase
MNMKTIDFRSDTVTRPNAAMRAAMAAAEVGDDVWGDDPTVNRLQAICAERAGFEDGLFLPSGTQSNLAALMSHCHRGDEYIVGQAAHTYKYEGGGAAVLGSIQPQPLENDADGSIPLAKISSAVKPADDHFARTKLLALENTIGGKVLPPTYVSAAQQLARSRGLNVHLDGARVANAAVAMNVSLAEVCAGFDSVSICLSKGLGAPVGSVLVGTKELVRDARRWRKMLGGGMRQAGVLAAACLYALDHQWHRLADDHANAANLAAALRDVDEIAHVEQATNMIFVTFDAQKVPTPQLAALQSHLFSSGILAAIGPTTRLVTHLDVSAQDMVTFVGAVKDFFAGNVRAAAGVMPAASGYAALPKG